MSEREEVQTGMGSLLEQEVSSFQFPFLIFHNGVTSHSWEAWISISKETFTRKRLEICILKMKAQILFHGHFKFQVYFEEKKKTKTYHIAKLSILTFFSPGFQHISLEGFCLVHLRNFCSTIFFFYLEDMELSRERDWRKSLWYLYDITCSVHQHRVRDMAVWKPAYNSENPLPKIHRKR